LASTSSSWVDSLRHSSSSILAGRAAAAARAAADKRSSTGGPTKVTVDRTMVEALVKEHAKELSMLAPEARRTRIRELVAEHLAAQGRASLALPVSAASLRSAALGKHLDSERSVDQRLLLEWMLVLVRIMSFTGEMRTLGAAVAVNKVWKGALTRSGSTLAKKLWKWNIRFGEEIRCRGRWSYWKRLLSQHPESARRLKTLTNEDFQTCLKKGQSDPSLQEARSVIAADLPRTFAFLFAPSSAAAASASSEDLRGGALEGEGSRRSPLLLLRPPAAPETAGAAGSLSSLGLAGDGIREALERILVAVAADNPSIGYCQGLDIIAAFALSVALESGLDLPKAEAEVFTFVATSLELEYIRSWLEPPLFGLRAAAAAVAGLLQERQPRLVEHLRSEGAGMELLCLAWLQTLFSNCSPLPRASLCRIWECWLNDGTPKIFFQTALALFQQAEPALLHEPLEVISEVLRTFPPPLDAALAPEELIARAAGTKVSASCVRSAIAKAEVALRTAATTTAPSSAPAAPLQQQQQRKPQEPELLLDLDFSSTASPPRHGVGGRGGYPQSAEPPELL